MNNGLYRNFRIATTQAALTRGYFFLLKIPPPTSCEYRDHSVAFSKSQGGNALHGYHVVDMLWEQLTTTQAYAIKKKVDDALDGTGYLYMTINRSNGTGSGIDWIDVRGIPHMTSFKPDGRIAGSTGVSISNAELKLNNIQILVDPAVFT